MSWIYLIRHGQAGTRDEYDSLSDMGAVQARMLGEYLASERIHFSAVYSGGLKRQRDTAREVSRTFKRAGLPFPDYAINPRWNEFDLDAVYRGMAPRLCADDPEFRAEYQSLQAELERGRGKPEAAIHRGWTKCDIAVVRAWVEARYPFEGESWAEFQARVGLRKTDFASDNGHEQRIAIFTSATPTAVCVGRALGIDGRHTLRLAGALLNTSFSVLRLVNGEFNLFSFNNVPHLTDTYLRTFR
ncbi:MAG: histidine phosphatase family protein [Bryobacteraceae bacterium]